MTTPTTVPVRLRLRADTAANWTSVNPILLANELGRETDTGKIKIGNGTSTWTSLAYQAWATLPVAVNAGGTGQTSYTNGQLLIGNTTGNTLTKATLTAGSGVAITNGTGSITVAASGIANTNIAADAEIAVSKLQDGTARQLLQTAANGTDVEWASNIDIPGTLDVTGNAVFDANLTVQGDLTVNGTETIINTQTLTVEDKNIELGKITSPTDVTADGGGITLKGTTDKTINWIDATDAWTLSEHVDLATGKEYRINGTKVLDATSLGTSVLITSANITDGTIVNADVNASAAIAGTKISPNFGSQNVVTTGTSTAASLIPTGSSVPGNGVYLPAPNSVGISTNGNERARIDSSGTFRVKGAGTAGVTDAFAVNGSAPASSAQIDSSGRLLVGTSTFAQTNTYSLSQLLNIAGGPSNGVQLQGYSNNEFSIGIDFSKSRSSSVGTNTIVQNGDSLGIVLFNGYDGAAYHQAARIIAQVDGTPGANDMPGRLVFSVTADGASTPTEALRISNNRAITVSDGGNVVLGTTTGTKIGTATTQKLGFYNATPVVQPTAVADATDAATAISQLNALLAHMRTLGLIAT